MNKDKPVILIVDDQPQNIELLEAYLAPQGYEIVTAANGEEALEKISGNQIDLILLDIIMPGMDGFEVTRRIRQDNTHRLLPIILLTVLQETEDRVKGIEAGCDDFISRPIDKTELLARVRSLLKVKAYNDLLSNYRNELESEVIKRTEELKQALENLRQDIIERKRAEENLRESNERYKALFDHSLDLVYITDLDGHFIDANDAALNRLGYTREDIRSLNFASLLSEDQLPLAFKTLQEIRETGIHESLMELKLRHKNGSAIYVETRGSAIMSNGTPVAIQAVARDITDRKQAEGVLRESEEKFRVLADSTPTGVMLYQDDRWIYANRAAEIICGYSEKELLAMNFWDIVHPDFKPLIQERGRMRQQGKNPKTRYELKIIMKDGSEKWVDLSGASTMIKERRAGIINVLDINDRKLAEEDLKKSENKYRLLADNIHDVVFVLDMNLNYTYVSPSIKFLRGYEPEEVLKQSYIDILTPSSMDLAMKTLSDVMELEKIKHQEITESRTLQLEMRRKDGTTVWTEVKFSFIRDEDQRPVGILGLTRDITQHRKGEEALRVSEYKYKSLIENIPDIIFTIDLEGKVTFINQRMKEILGYESAETINMNILNFIPEEDHQRAMENLHKGMKGEKIKNLQIPMIAKSGERLIFECSFSRVYKDGAVVGAQGTAVDITERKQAGDALRESEEKYRTILEDMDDVYFEVDIKGNITFVNASSCKMSGYSEEELIGMPFKKISAPDGIEKVMQYFGEIFLTGKTGKPFLWNLVKKNGEQGFFEIVTSLIKNKNGKLIGFRGIGRDVTERKRAEEELHQTLNSLKKAFGATVQVMVSAVEMRDPYTAGHQLRVANLACAIATEMGLPQEKINGIRMAGSIHDIGKLSIPAEILSKPTRLTNIEFSLIKEHSQIGYDMLKDVESPWPLAQIVYQHHERMDGSGYPRKLKGDEILMEARIMTVADVVEAMASHRPYRPSLGIEAALEEIEKNKGIFYDSTVADACLRLFREKGYQLEG